MEIAKKKIVGLRKKVVALREDYSKSSGIFEARLSDLSREILDIIEPPRKGYVRFKTIDGWVQFKPRKKKAVV